MDGSNTTSRPPLRGYNHNIRYKVRIYHVQTEDSGLENPHVFTHLFLEGMIVSSMRSEYKHLLDEEDRDEQVRKVMQDQHKRIMRQLRRGALDDKIIRLVGTLKPAEAGATVAAVADDDQPPAEAQATVDVQPATETPPEAETPPVEEIAPPPAAAPPEPTAAPELAPFSLAALEGGTTVGPAAAPPTPARAAPAAAAAATTSPPAVKPAPRPAPAPVAPPSKPAPAAHARPSPAVPPAEQMHPLAAVAAFGGLSDEISALEAQSIMRGTAVSRQIAAAQSKQIGQPIPLEHPAFSGIPLFDMDETGDDDALELDLDAIDNLDLDAQPGALLPPGALPGDMPFQGSDQLEVELALHPGNARSNRGRALDAARVESPPGTPPGVGEEFDLDDDDAFAEDDYTDPGLGAPCTAIPGTAAGDGGFILAAQRPDAPADDAAKSPSLPAIPALDPEEPDAECAAPQPPAAQKPPAQEPPAQEPPAEKKPRRTAPSLPDIPTVPAAAPDTEPPPRRRPRSVRLKRPPSMKIRPVADSSVQLPPREATTEYPMPQQRFRPGKSGATEGTEGEGQR